MTEVDSRRAWLTAFLGFAAMFVSVGTGFSHGVLVLPVSRDLGVGQGSVAGVFALTIMVFFFMGAPAGMLADRVGTRLVLLLGAVAMGSGLLVTATAQSVVALYLGHGVLVGVAMSTSFIPLTAVVSALFERHRSMAVGVAVSGIGLGTLVMAPLLAASIRLLGWRETYLGLSAAATLALVGCAVLLDAPRRRATRAPALSESMGSVDYRLMYASQVLLSVAIFTPFAHLPAYAESAGVAPVTAAGLVGMVGAASVVGRLALAAVATRFGLLRVYRVCFTMIGASFAFWLWPGGGYAALAVHAVVLGVGYGGFVALLPGIVAQRFGVHRLGGLLGVLYTSHVFGAGLGPLATGLLIERHGYVPAGVAGLLCGLAAAVVLGRVGRGEPAPAEPGQPRPTRR
jgi:predicted MFS family arabinose efflux permease